MWHIHFSHTQTKQTQTSAIKSSFYRFGSVGHGSRKVVWYWRPSSTPPRLGKVRKQQPPHSRPRRHVRHWKKGKEQPDWHDDDEVGLQFQPGAYLVSVVCELQAVVLILAATASSRDDIDRHTAHSTIFFSLSFHLIWRKLFQVKKQVDCFELFRRQCWFAEVQSPQRTRDKILRENHIL